MQTYITHIDVCTEEGIVRNGSLAVEDGRIKAIFPFQAERTDGYDLVIDGKGLMAIPGYIDAHCHGGGGFDFTDGSVEAAVGIRDFYAGHGVTTLYPTLAANSIPATIDALNAVREAMRLNRPGKPELCGVHLEGPFLNRAFKGSQAGDFLIDMSDKHFHQLYVQHSDVVRRTTIAPETGSHVAYFPALRRLGIQVSVGHSTAEYEQVVHAASQGATSVTHLYNAMSQTKKVGPFRVGGVVEAALTLDTLYAEIVADGYHLTNELIRIAYRCKGADKLSVCSDANRAAGGTHGEVFHACGMTYVIEQGVAMNSERTSLASSVTPIDGMVRHLIFNVGLPAVDVVRMASGATARMMGIAARKGSIAVGKDADLNLVDEAFHVLHSFCKGVQVR